MHYNILQAECTMQRYSLQHPRAVAIFLDFKAAFPSVSREFMWTALRGINLPEHWIIPLQRFYLGNRQFIGRRQKEASDAEVGIRQGCPLSPLLFV
eukprot:8630917-Alexandrium_andersonii.AAC.1